MLARVDPATELREDGGRRMTGGQVHHAQRLAERARPGEQLAQGVRPSSELEDADPAGGEPDERGRALDHQAPRLPEPLDRGVVALPRLGLVPVYTQPRVRRRGFDLVRLAGPVGTDQTSRSRMRSKPRRS